MKRPLIAFLVALFAGAPGSPVLADWPVRLDSASLTDATTAGDLMAATVSPTPTGGGLADIPVQAIRTPIRARQWVNDVVGTPRPVEPAGGIHRFLDKAPYLHNGTDLKAPEPTRVFTIEDGEVRKVRPSGDFESVWIGNYRYMHIDLENWLSDVNIKAYKDAGDRKMFVRAGTLIGRTKTLVTRGMTPHLHLQREIVDEGYHNALAYLRPWSDGYSPDIAPDHDRTDGPVWNRPAVRIVRAFKPGDNTHDIDPNPPSSFSSLDALDEMRRPIPIVDGPIDILCRASDNLSTTPARLATGSVIVGSETNSIPVEMGYRLEPVDVLSRADISPTTYNVSCFEHIPFGKGTDGGESGSARAASSDFFHKVYFVLGEEGTVSGPPRRRDFILTNHRDEELAPDTDTARTRNGRYMLTVVATDLGSSDPAPAVGTTTTTTRTLILCNPALADRATRVSTEPPVRPGAFRPGDRVRLRGHNFFTPLAAGGTGFETPQVALLEVTGGVTRRVTGLDLRQTVNPNGDNLDGTVDLDLPPTGLDEGRTYHAAVLIRCDPTTPQGQVDEPDWSQDTRPHPKLVMAESASRPYHIMFADLDPASVYGPQRIRTRIRMADEAGTLHTLFQTEGFSDVAWSADGRRFAVSHEVADWTEQIDVCAVTGGSASTIASVLPSAGVRVDTSSLNENGTRLAYFRQDSLGGQEIRVRDIEVPASDRAVFRARDGETPDPDGARHGSIEGPVMSVNGRYLACGFRRSYYAPPDSSWNQLLFTDLESSSPPVKIDDSAVYSAFIADNGSIVYPTYAAAYGYDLRTIQGQTRTILTSAVQTELSGLSRDGRVALFWVLTGSGYALDVRRIDQSTPTLLHRVVPPDGVLPDGVLSSDGRFLLVRLITLPHYSDSFVDARFQVHDLQAGTVDEIASNVLVQYGNGLRSTGGGHVSPFPPMTILP